MNRKLVQVFICLAFFAQTIFAQDIITKQNGDAIKVKILEVSTETVKYKKFEFQNGPDYVIPASEIFMIKYETSSKDIFEKNPATGQIQIRHIPAEIKTPAPTPPTSPPPAPTSGQSGSQIKPSSNGTFELLGFDGASVSFRAVVATPIYMVSLRADGRTVDANTINNTKGDIVFGSGTTAIEGSSLSLGGQYNIPMPEGMEARCDFESIPAGFVAKTIVFLTGKNAAPMSYDLASGEWTLGVNK
jgi:hypothetical protein